MKLKSLSAVAGLSLAMTAIPAAFAQVSNFDSLNGYATGVEARLAKARNGILRVGSTDAQPNLVATASFVDRQIDAASDNIERSTDGGGGSLGYTHVAGNWNLGFTLASDSTTSDYNEVNSPSPTPLRGAVKARTVEGTVSAGLTFGQSRLAVFGTLGKTSNEGTRISDAGSSSADYDSSDSAFGLQYAYTLDVSDALLVQPFAGISTASADTDGFTEQGTAPDRRILNDFTMRETRGALGVRVAAKEGSWIPFASAAWLSRLSGGDTSITNSAINGSNLGSGAVPASSSGLFYLGAGVNGTLAEKWLGGFEVQYFTGGDEQQLGLTASLRRSF